MGELVVKSGIGHKMHAWATDLFPICRSITGNGVRQTLAYIKKLLPDLSVCEVPSGTKAFDWTVPDEWNIRDAYIEDETGNRIIDFKKHNLHVVSYSEPVDAWFTLEELDKHLYSLPEQPGAIPYITSCYKRCWGFCLTHEQRLKLKLGKYHAVIDCSLKPGSLTYGELILRGAEEKEILLSTYICHPSMGNNELSGPVVTSALAQWLVSLKNRRYTYRILFVPETIGSIVYLSGHLDVMKRNTIAGFVVSCVGDDRSYSYLHSPWDDTLADRVAKHTLKHHAPKYNDYYFWERGGSDEQQYCSPNVRLPVVSVMRSKPGTYPEYHTSLDDLSFVTPSGLEGGYEVLRQCLMVLENNYFYRVPFPCEPHMAKRNTKHLYSKRFTKQSLTLMRLLNYLDGEHDLIKVCDQIGSSLISCIPIIQELLEHKIIQLEKSQYR